MLIRRGLFVSFLTSMSGIAEVEGFKDTGF
jgi:hypothetical protein